MYQKNNCNLTLHTQNVMEKEIYGVTGEEIILKKNGVFEIIEPEKSVRKTIGTETDKEVEMKAESVNKDNI